MNSVKSSPESSPESTPEVDYEGLPVLGVGQKKILKVKTYEELHTTVAELVRIIEEVYELGIMKGTAKKFHVFEEASEEEQSSENEEEQVCPD